MTENKRTQLQKTQQQSTQQQNANASANVRKQAFLTYYDERDYEEIVENLPNIVRNAERKAGEILEPTTSEKLKVMASIKDYLRKNKKKVYGGTALNETIKFVNQADAIYDEYCFPDVEFYSDKPIVDLVNICNQLYELGYKYIIGKEAQHEETFTIFVNFQLYCDITYIPTRIEKGIKTIEIDGINYVHPHFMLIDYLRVFNQPLTAAGQRWEKYFPRMYKLLKNYPLEKFRPDIKLDPLPPILQKCQQEIRNVFLLSDKLNDEAGKKTALISGFEAYNFYVKHSATIINKAAKNVKNIQNDTTNMEVIVPYIELSSVSFKDTVEKLYNFLKTQLDPAKIRIDEYYPLFQFTSYSVTFYYEDHVVAKVYDRDGYCIPLTRTKKGYVYVSYQYVLMLMLIDRFRAFVDNNKQYYFIYGVAISNLITARNRFLNRNDLPIINNTVFTEFGTSCVGSTISYSRESRLRGLENYKNKKMLFKYVPEAFFKSSEEAQARFDPKRYMFKNSSGNKITNEKNLIFHIDDKFGISIAQHKHAGAAVPTKDAKKEDSSSSSESEESSSSSSTSSEDDTAAANDLAAAIDNVNIVERANQ